MGDEHDAWTSSVFEVSMPDAATAGIVGIAKDVGYALSDAVVTSVISAKSLGEYAGARVADAVGAHETAKSLDAAATEDEREAVAEMRDGFEQMHNAYAAAGDLGSAAVGFGAAVGLEFEQIADDAGAAIADAAGAHDTAARLSADSDAAGRQKKADWDEARQRLDRAGSDADGGPPVAGGKVWEETSDD